MGEDVKIKKKVSLNKLQCKTLALMIYDKNENEFSLLYKIQSKNMICSGLCNPCYQDLDTGNKCRKSMFRWHYNLNKEKCTEFIYNGCGGNDNNFKSLTDCNRICNKTEGL